MNGRTLLLAAILLIGDADAQDVVVRLHAAGSLRAVMTEMAHSFRASEGADLTMTFGASGLLRERVERGERTDVFASADVQNAQLLADAGRSRAPNVFARNQLCALVAPGVEVSEAALLERMLDPAVKLGTSTPKADPSGDYAWELFAKADKLVLGAYAALDRKALKLTGGADSPTPPPGRSVYAMLIADRKADIFLTYCTNAIAAAHEVPGARMLAISAALAVGASYALVVMTDAGPGAQRFALFVLSVPGQRILERHGFMPVALP
jgi:molybdate transport system substrate-binding protein